MIVHNANGGLDIWSLAGSNLLERKQNGTLCLLVESDSKKHKYKEVRHERLDGKGERSIFYTLAGVPFLAGQINYNEVIHSEVTAFVNLSASLIMLGADNKDAVGPIKFGLSFGIPTSGQLTWGSDDVQHQFNMSKSRSLTQILNARDSLVVEVKLGHYRVDNNQADYYRLFTNSPRRYVLVEAWQNPQALRPNQAIELKLSIGFKAHCSS
jgi:hypothetical protein